MCYKYNFQDFISVASHVERLPVRQTDLGRGARLWSQIQYTTYSNSIQDAQPCVSTSFCKSKKQTI
jgi:hypothetical protein